MGLQWSYRDGVTWGVNAGYRSQKAPARRRVEVWEKGIRKESAAALAGELRKEPRMMVWRAGRKASEKEDVPRGLKNRVS